jgi:glycosyltransferase involved in cell wall biosynthesis
VSPARPKVSVVFPCLNERESVGACVAEARDAMRKERISCEVIVADNGSSDGSAAAAEAAGARVVTEPRRGYGFAVGTGVDASRGQVVLIADVDGTYPLDEGPAFVRAALAEPDLVLGSRFAGRIMPGAMPTLHRLVGSPATRLLLRMLLGIRSSDPHSGMRAMRREVFDAIRPVTGSWEFTFEMLVNAARRSVRVREIPITYRKRIGTSKLRALPEGWGFFRFMILHSPAFLFIVPGLLAMALGAAFLGWLLQVDRSIGSANFGINSLVVGALATIVGYQLVALGTCARAYMDTRNPAQIPRRRPWFTLERGLVAGLLLLVAGVSVVASVGARWLASDFPQLARSDHGLAIVGLTAAVVGMQTIFSSFFLSLFVRDGQS